MNDSQLHRLARAIARKVATPPSDATRAAHLDAITRALDEADAPVALADRRRFARVLPNISGSNRLIPAFAAAVLLLAIVVTPVLRGSSNDLPMLSASGAKTGDMSGNDALMERSNEMSAPDVMWYPMNYVFRLADGADISAGKSPAWRLESSRTAQQHADLLSALFGLPASTPSDWDPQTRIAGDAEQRSVTVYPSGEWYYANYPAYPQWTCTEPDGQAAPTPGSQESSERREPAMIDDPCTPPAKAENLPSTAEARQLATTLFAQLGITDIVFEEPYQDDWTVSLWGTQKFAELPGYHGQGVSVTFGANGEILGAYGSFARPVLIGDYPTISAAEAVERLNSQFSTGGGMARPLPAPAPMVDGDQAVSDMAIPEKGMPGSTEGETIEVTLVSVTIVPSAIWAADGYVVIAPHYRFIDTDGQEWWVAAVSDAYLAG